MTYCRSVLLFGTKGEGVSNDCLASIGMRVVDYTQRGPRRVIYTQLATVAGVEFCWQVTREP